MTSFEAKNILEQVASCITDPENADIKNHYDCIEDLKSVLEAMDNQEIENIYLF